MLVDCAGVGRRMDGEEGEMSYPDEVIEKVARAVYASSRSDPTEEHYRIFHDRYVDLAVAALDALGLREETRPTGTWIHPDAYRTKRDEHRYVTEWEDA